jgi:hypothetical protein
MIDAHWKILRDCKCFSRAVVFFFSSRPIDMLCFCWMYVSIWSYPSDAYILSDEFPIILWRTGCSVEIAHFPPGVTSWSNIGYDRSHAFLAALSHHTLNILSRERFCSNNLLVSSQDLVSACPLTHCKVKDDGGMALQWVNKRSAFLSRCPWRRLNCVLEFFWWHFGYHL